MSARHPCDEEVIAADDARDGAADVEYFREPRHLHWELLDRDEVRELFRRMWTGFKAKQIPYDDPERQRVAMDGCVAFGELDYLLFGVEGHDG